MKVHRFLIRLLPFACVLSANAAQGTDERSWYLSPDSVTGVYGSGNDVSILGGKIRTKDWKSFSLGSWNGHVVLEGGLMFWEGKILGPNNHIVDIGVTPVLRLEYPGFGYFTPYVEGGIGAHLISKVHINGTRTFSTAFQFGEHLGAGVRFGARKEYAAGVFLQHISNGSIKRPNNGLTYWGLNVSYQFK